MSIVIDLNIKLRGHEIVIIVLKIEARVFRFMVLCLVYQRVKILLVMRTR